MVDEMDESSEVDENLPLAASRSYKTPLELFEDRKTVRICAPMVRYSKYTQLFNVFQLVPVH